MSIPFPELEELYACIVNDCYLLFLAQKCEQGQSIKELFQQKKNKKDILDMSNTLKSEILINKAKNKKYYDITSFSLDYLKKISEFFSQDKITNISVRFYNDFCLAYIALEGFRNVYVGLKEDEIFVFLAEKFRYFSEFLDKYQIITKIKNYYEKYSNEIKTEYNNDNNVYIYLILKFDSSFIFYNNYTKKIKNKNEESSNNENKQANQNSLHSESNNGVDTKENSDKKAKNLINIEQENNNNKKQKFDKNINNLNENKDKTKIKINPSTLNNLKEDSKKVEIVQKSNENNEIKIDNINIKGEQDKDKNKNEINKYEFKELSNHDLNIKIEFQVLKLNFKLLKTEDKLLINSTDIKLGKEKIEYFQAYIQLLQQAIINFSNPYNFNFWRKLSNIILKNIFIILKNKNFTIVQNRNMSILGGIESIANKMKTKYNIKDNTFKKIESMKKKIKEGNQTENSSPAADKSRNFNLITIAKNGKEYILGSLSIDFLFYLKEKGNQIDHFDETMLNFVLFNGLNITEEDLKEFEKIKSDEAKDNIVNIDIVASEKELIDGKNKGLTKTIEQKSKNIEDKEPKNEIKQPEESKNKEITGKELVQLLKNPFNFQTRIIKNNNLIESIYEKIDEIKKGLSINDDNKEISEIKNDYKNLFLNIKELKKIIEFDIQKNYDSIELNIQNIPQIIKSVDSDSNLKEKLNMYLELQDLDNQITQKIIFYEEKNKEFIELGELLKKYENEMNEHKKKIKERIEKISELINLSDIFDEYKTQLKDNFLDKSEYKQHTDIFNKENIDNFKINNFFGFLEAHLKDHSFSIIKRDITNYNMFIEIINSFPELRNYYAKNIDVNF